MKPRIGFAIEQALGHVAFGMGLKSVLAGRADFDCEWLDVPYPAGAFERVPILGTNWTVRGSLRTRRAIDHASRTRPFDALFIHTQTIALFSVAHMKRVPTLLSLDATPINYDEFAPFYGDRVHAAPVERLKLWTHRSVMRHVARFTTFSEWAKQSLIVDYGVDPERVIVIHPGTNLSNYPDPAALGTGRREGPLRVLFVGGDFVRKGGDLLLEVCRSLKGQVELHLVTSADVPSGDGVFVYRGLKPLSSELFERYREADVFVLPTRADCLANVLGEAMASCLPIITTRVGAHAEAVEDGGSGYLIEPDDSAGLHDRLCRLVADRELLKRMGKRSREIGEERFDMRKSAAKIGDILMELAEPRN